MSAAVAALLWLMRLRWLLAPLWPEWTRVRVTEAVFLVERPFPEFKREWARAMKNRGELIGGDTDGGRTIWFNPRQIIYIENV